MSHQAFCIPGLMPLTRSKSSNILTATPIGGIHSKVYTSTAPAQVSWLLEDTAGKIVFRDPKGAEVFCSRAADDVYDYYVVTQPDRRYLPSGTNWLRVLVNGVLPLDYSLHFNSRVFQTPSEASGLSSFGDAVYLQDGVVTPSFETVSKNLASVPVTFNYTGTYLTSVLYNVGEGLFITKTLNYDNAGALTSLVLSGDTPFGISLTKHFTYVSGNLVGITYS